MMRSVPGRRILPPLLPAFLAFLSVPAQASIPAKRPHEPNAAAALSERRSGLVSTNPMTRVRRIRVRIAEAQARVHVQGLDLKIFEGGAGRAIPRFAARLEGDGTWELRCQQGRVRAIRTQGSGELESLELVEPVTVDSPAGFLKFQGKNYRETLRVWSTGSLCEVVNEVDLEKYLQGLVNAEFSSRWKASAVEAQIVAARSYALHQMERRQDHFDLDSTERDQVYQGPDREDPQAARLVEKTRGLVLMAPDGTASASALKAFYHSTCGGETEMPENVWGTPMTGFGRVKCPFCASSPRFRWGLPLSSSELSAAVVRGSRQDGPQLGWPRDAREWIARSELADVQLEDFSESNRVARVRMTWVDRKTGRFFSTPVSGARFRAWIGASKLLSASFTVRPPRSAHETTWRFEGRGNGHGVGMCQWGAKVMGERGFTMASILKHYYPGVLVKKLW